MAPCHISFHKQPKRTLHTIHIHKCRKRDMYSWVERWMFGCALCVCNVYETCNRFIDNRCCYTRHNRHQIHIYFIFICRNVSSSITIARALLRTNRPKKKNNMYYCSMGSGTKALRRRAAHTHTRTHYSWRCFDWDMRSLRSARPHCCHWFSCVCVELSWIVDTAIRLPYIACICLKSKVFHLWQYFFFLFAKLCYEMLKTFTAKSVCSITWWI